MLLIVDEPVECFESVVGYKLKSEPLPMSVRLSPDSGHSAGLI